MLVIGSTVCSTTANIIHDIVTNTRGTRHLYGSTVIGVLMDTAISDWSTADLYRKNKLQVEAGGS
jgi:hypothetical protein